jgi:hypothetical protein
MGKEVFNYYRMGAFIRFGILKFILDHPIFASKLMLLQSVIEIHNARWTNRDVDYFKYLEEIKKVY